MPAAVLMAAPLALGDVTINISDTLVSVPYVDMTIQLMERFGARVSRTDDWRQFVVRGGQRYVTPGSAYVEGDASSASYFLAARTHPAPTRAVPHPGARGASAACEPRSGAPKRRRAKCGLERQRRRRMSRVAGRQGLRLRAAKTAAAGRQGGAAGC